MIGLMPAEVDSVTAGDREKRIIRIRIPGLTDGATELPEAQLCNPIGDKSEHTEIRIKAGDRVWLAFEGGDTRYPVIVGFRPRNQENGIDWRRFEHANFQFDADNVFQVIAGTQVHVVAPLVTVDADSSVFSGAVTINGLLTYTAGLNGTGPATMSGTLTNNNKNIGSTHTHSGVQSGGSTSGQPT